MTRNQLVKQLAEISTRPISASATSDSAVTESASLTDHAAAPTELFVWFEDTAARALEGRRGVAGLPESLLPISREMKVVERRYAENHLHLLSAVRISCRQNAAELIASSIHRSGFARRRCRAAVRGFFWSMDQSTRRLNSIAAVRAKTMQRRTSPSTRAVGRPFAATRSAPKAKGRAKIVWENRISRRKRVRMFDAAGAAAGG